ncbi:MULTISPECIES: alpha-ketoglutarate-dependent dioxygenase AlkB [unclassified Brevundimonas]|uniref:alpha-ketoglutarate-dependent dioxygenase AlkB n=1 Tax=unclassified Brevundimonas TaxID=2622653 RepID=UPI0025B7E432|nr:MULTISPECIES: alpha-ketoglutarate-dependent dioxygenase AlkB [unclassified Brevundimonas]
MSVRSATTSAPVEVETAVEGFRLWTDAFDAAGQAALVAAVFERLEQAPLYRPITPGGRPFSVEMSNFGPLGWVSDRAGYRYQATHPMTGRPWPAIPPVLLNLWRDTVNWPEPPDACLVNLYRDGARMGLHQDRDEADLGAPVLSVSLGDAALFRIGPAEGGRTTSLRLNSGDVCALTGPARLARHGIDRVLAGSSRLIPGGGRLNLTLRRAGVSPG